MENFAKGSEYDRLLGEFLDRGGDLSRCPFETADYKWEEPPYDRIGSDSDMDPVVDEMRKDIREGKIKLTGTTPSDEQWKEWEREYEEIKRRKP